MAHYDQATKDFINEVSSDQKPTQEAGKIPFAVKQVAGLARDLSKGRGQVEPAIAKRIIRLTTGHTVKELEKTSGVSALSVYTLLNQHYLDEWHDWEPETLWQTLEMEHAIQPSDEIKNLVQALQVICKTDFAFEDFSVFENVGHAINMNPVLFGQIQPLEPDEAALTVKVLRSIRPKEEFEDEVEGYIAACAKRAGMVYLPDDIFPSDCQRFLDAIGNDMSLKYRVITNSSGEDVEIQIGRIQEVRDYIADK
jgi:hypothetical protein